MNVQVATEVSSTHAAWSSRYNPGRKSAALEWGRLEQYHVGSGTGKTSSHDRIKKHYILSHYWHDIRYKERKPRFVRQTLVSRGFSVATSYIIINFIFVRNFLLCTWEVTVLFQVCLIDSPWMVRIIGCARIISMTVATLCNSLANLELFP